MLITRKDIAARLVVITSTERQCRCCSRSCRRSARFFTWAMQMGYTRENPVIGSVRPQGSEGRSHVLSDDELAAVWRACKDDDFGLHRAGC